MTRAGGRFEVRGIGGIRVAPEIVQRGRQDIVRGIQHVDAAFLEFGQPCRVEHEAPAVDCRIGPENLAGLFHIEADADRAPHVIDGILVAGIVGGEALGDRRPDIDEVRQLRLVELLEHPGLDLSLEEIGGRHHHVVTGFAGQQLGLQRIVGIEGVVADPDSGLPGEIFEHARRDIVRPIVDVYETLGLRHRAPGKGGDRRETRYRQYAGRCASFPSVIPVAAGRQWVRRCRRGVVRAAAASDCACKSR